MERIFLREKADDKLVRVIEKQKIGVVGMSECAGVTLTATSIAKALSRLEDRNVTFLEVGGLRGKRSLIYDAAGMDKRFKTREFTRFYRDIKNGENIRGKSNPDEGVNWCLITPEDVKDEIELTPIENVRLINNISGDIIVCDISNCDNSADYLLDMDTAVFVIDPMPSRMISGYPFMREVKRIEYKGKKVIWVINKYNPGINKRELRDFLKLKEYYKIPFIAAENFYSAEYNCKIPYENKDIRVGLEEFISGIVSGI